MIKTITSKSKYLANVLGRCNRPIFGPKVRLEHASKDLLQDLETNLGDGRVVTPLAELVPDEGVLGPGKLMEAKDDAGFTELGANEVATRIRHVGVLDAED